MSNLGEIANHFDIDRVGSDNPGGQSNLTHNDAGQYSQLQSQRQAERLESLNAAQPQPGQRTSEEDQLYPIAVLIDELRNEDIGPRLKATKQLTTIALALGPERTREELLPFLKEAAYDEDEILLCLVEQIGKFVPYVGGKEFAYTILPCLEQLSASEEAIVRDKTTEVLSHLCTKHLPKEHVEQYFLPAVKRLAAGQWFSSRCSSCSLFSPAYAHLSSTIQAEVRQLYINLCQDDTPMVRRAAAGKLADFTRTILESSSNPDTPPSSEAQKVVTQELYPAFLQLIADEHDSVRLESIHPLLAMAEFSQNSSAEAEERGSLIHQDAIIPLLLDMVDDKSWRVRHVVSSKFPEFLKYFYPNAQYRDDVIHAFVTLLHDQENEVRSASAEKIYAFCEALPVADRTDVIKECIMPIVNQMVRDTNQLVKSAIAKSITELAPLVGQDFTIENLLPLILAQLRDECPEVRLNIIAHLGSVDKIIGSEHLAQSLLPTILELSEDPKWRIRLAIISHIPVLADQLGEQIFNESLADLTLKLLTDPVYAIREAAVQNLQKLAKSFDLDWSKQRILPKLEELKQDQNYLRRMTCLFTAKEIVAGKSELLDLVLPLILGLGGDKIPNVRFNVAKCFTSMKGSLNKDHISSGDVEKVLGALSEDADSDVSYYALEAQKTLGYVQ